MLLKKGNIVKANCNPYPKFDNCLGIDEGTLEAGEYHILVDPVWDPTAEKDDDYKDILIDVYCVQDIDVFLSGAEVLQDLHNGVLRKAREN